VFCHLRNGWLSLGLRNRTFPARAGEFTVNGSLFGTIPVRSGQFRLPC
jgi:hypothetical protein